LKILGGQLVIRVDHTQPQELSDRIDEQYEEESEQRIERPEPECASQ
jgi:hypothetical protein